MCLVSRPVLCYDSPTFSTADPFERGTVMRFHRALPIVVALVTLLVPAVALPQALPNINLLRVRYNSAKTAAKPEGELKTQVDQIDQALAEATRAGRTGEQRRLFAKGLA